MNYQNWSIRIWYVNILCSWQKKTSSGKNKTRFLPGTSHFLPAGDMSGEIKGSTTDGWNRHNNGFRPYKVILLLKSALGSHVDTDFQTLPSAIQLPIYQPKSIQTLSLNHMYIGYTCRYSLVHHIWEHIWEKVPIGN